MKQVVQRGRARSVELLDVPEPVVLPGHVLVHTCFSVVSAGTERAIVQSASRSVVARARARPDLVRQVLVRALREGPEAVYRGTMERLDAPMPLGYSAAGIVLAAGEGVEAIKAGTAVACAGAGIANHAERLLVPVNLCAPVPDGVPLDAAAYASIGAIALQSVRVLGPQLGEVVGLVGLGLVGHLTLQLLRRAGCRIVVMDVDPARAALARTLGAHQAVTTPQALREAASDVTGGQGLDGVVLAAATPSNEPITLAGELCREKGRVVVLGDVGLELPREVYYRKELDLRLSRSYGPGRYDPEYEVAGLDYPYAYVRWTEQRNLSAFLDLLADGGVQTQPLAAPQLPLERAAEAYALLASPSGNDDPAREPRPLSVVLTYSSPTDPVTEAPPAPRVVALDGPHGPWRAPASAGRGATLRIGCIGAGSFARSTLFPALRRVGSVMPVAVAASTGLSARTAQQLAAFQRATTDVREVLEAPDVDAVIIATRHDTHAALAVAAMRAGKSVFVEKPLGLTTRELAEALAAQRDTGALLMVGFNRRFAPLTDEVKEFLAGAPGPLSMTCRVNAGPLPAGSWVNDPARGGGRIVAEACHFVDLIHFLAGAQTVSVYAGAYSSPGVAIPDNVVATLRLAGGGTASLVYTTSAGRAGGKERVEGFAVDRAFLLDDFVSAHLAMGVHARVRRTGLLRQDKGHFQELRAFVAAALAGRPSPVPPDAAALASLVTLKLLESAASHAPATVDLGEVYAPASTAPRPPTMPSAAGATHPFSV